MLLSRIKTFNVNMKRQYEADDIYHSNEVQANRMLMSVLVGNAVVLILILLAVEAGLFPVSGAIVRMTIYTLVVLTLLWIITRIVKQDTWWLKYLLLVSLILTYGRIDALLTHKVAILMVLPVLCSSRYFSRRLTIGISILTAVIFFFTAIYGAHYGWINMNDVMVPVGSTVTNTTVWLGSGIEETLDRAAYTRNTLIFSFFPKLLMFGIASIISTNIAKRGRGMVEEQKELSKNSVRLETELHMATQIQEGMLPNIYPPFPGRKEFDIYGTMNPAREVGGDFFDYFLVDEDHLGMVVADVSGKGVPAALFMMASKIILANNAMMGNSPAQALEATNRAVCSNNPQEMFVTVWMGILEISTGILTAANAGHEYPALKKGEKFKLFKDKHGFVIGGFDDVAYTEYTIRLEYGDKIFLYTDGVPEATDQENRLFGTERMLDALNKNPDVAPRTLLLSVRDAVDQFVGRAEQFDDLTMLCLEYRYRPVEASIRNGTGKSGR